MEPHIGSVRHSLSFVPLYIEPAFEGQTLGRGTAFIYQHQSEDFLITNWHVVTGRRPWDGKCSPETAGIPDSLLVHMPVFVVQLGRVTHMEWSARKIPLYNDVAREKPAWLEHPEHFSGVDVVALPITGLANFSVVAANAPNLGLSNVYTLPGMDVFILGYPRGLSGGGKLPIWKRGSFASEPDFDLDGVPKVYVDTATKEGMSGAPVYAYQNGLVVPPPSPIRTAPQVKMGYSFVGVYSGRTLVEKDDPLSAQLAIVWKERALREIIEGKVFGPKSSHFY